MTYRQIFERLLENKSFTLSFESQKQLRQFRSNLSTFRYKLSNSFDSLGIPADFKDSVIRCRRIKQASTQDNIVIKVELLTRQQYENEIAQQSKTFTVISIDESEQSNNHRN